MKLQWQAFYCAVHSDGKPRCIHMVRNRRNVMAVLLMPGEFLLKCCNYLHTLQQPFTSCATWQACVQVLCIAS